MSASDPVRAAEALYDAELAERAVADVRPVCRKLLRQLKATTPDAYEAGVRRYEDELIPSIAAGTVNPLDGWIAYGGWLGDRLYGGRLVCVDSTGRSSDLGGALPAGGMALYLPDKDDQTGILIASPDQPTDYQAAARDLLCR